ncbi:40S ribosomal protein S2 [Heterocephalus glaber]|uniref:Small ribosomal subunit protein uS5 n=1 Tax=Heterocephalus glaber TaxID=10181 RepID=G5C9I9_HETGA|nr:40S ribosomal protein S2 [Heterocephalus glaber]
MPQVQLKGALGPDLWGPGEPGFHRGFSSGFKAVGAVGAAGAWAEPFRLMARRLRTRISVTKQGRLVTHLRIKSVQKQTRAGQQTRFKAFVAIGDYNGHCDLGVKCSKEVATATHGAIFLAKLLIFPVQRGYWRNKIGKPHTVPCKVTGRCGCVSVSDPCLHRCCHCLSPVPKKLLLMADIADCYTSIRGCTATLRNFTKGPFDAISKDYSYLTLDLWKEPVFTKFRYQEFSDHLVQTHTRVSVQRTQAPAMATT